MKKIAFILVFFTQFVNAQDKLFFANGKTKIGYIVSIGKDVVFFKANDTARVEQIKKTELVLIEDYKGSRYVLASKPSTSSPDSSEKKETLRQNAIRMQPFGIFFGRVTFSFEKLNKDQSIGYTIPLSLTFDPFGVLYPISDSSNRTHIESVKFITGLDVNFYISKKKHSRFFLGPRLRYGTDIFLQNTEALSLQTQFGWDFGSNANLFTQQFSFGFGFARVINSSFVGFRKNQSLGWFSFNYSLGFRW